MENKDLYAQKEQNIAEFFKNTSHEELTKPLSVETLLRMKSVLSCVNNLLTYKLTLAFAHWISKRLSFSSDQKDLIIKSVEQTSVNKNGYDVLIENLHIVAEVKCNIPLTDDDGNKTDKFGGNQKSGIKKDIEKLRKYKDNALNFMVLLDTPSVRKAFDEYQSALSQKLNVTFVIVNPDTNFSDTSNIYITFIPLE